MIDYSAITIDKLIIHKVGNKQKEIKNQVSDRMLGLDEDLSTHLINYFLTPFSKHGEVNKFSHHSNLAMNELYTYSKEMFSTPNKFMDISVKILNHLYEQSDHPGIKVGELLIVHFTDIIFDDKLTDAIGIFKIERKQNYFKFSGSTSNISVKLDKGISNKKMDKGCLIINIEDNDGYRVLSLDNNNYDAEYWINKFIGSKYVKDFYYHTSNAVDLCKSFSEEILHEQNGKDEQIAFLNKSINYMTEKEEFDMQEFAEEMFEEPVRRQEFFDYKKTYEEQKETELSDSFPISQNTVKKKKRAIKSLINLDTNIQIKLDSSDPETTHNFIEKGFDNERGMNYYKVYFNREQN